MKSHFDTAEKRSLTAESRCETLEFELNSKDIELKAKTEQIARLQADAQPARSSFLTAKSNSLSVFINTFKDYEKFK